MDFHARIAFLQQSPVLRPVMQPGLHRQIGMGAAGGGEIQAPGLGPRLFLDPLPAGRGVQHAHVGENVVEFHRQIAAQAQRLDRLVVEMGKVGPGWQDEPLRAENLGEFGEHGAQQLGLQPLQGLDRQKAFSWSGHNHAPAFQRADALKHVNISLVC